MGLPLSYSPSMGMPQMPGYLSELDGPLFDTMRNNALNPAASPWASQAALQEDAKAQTAIEKAGNTSAGQTAQQQAQLAAQGGLSSGARERIVEGGAKNMMNMVQDTGRQQGLNKLQIGVNDAQNKLQQLGQASQLEISNQKDLNAYNQNAYNQQMNAWAANRQAQATEDSGKK